jgi:hypothetical protein
VYSNGTSILSLYTTRKSVFEKYISYLNTHEDLSYLTFLYSFDYKTYRRRLRALARVLIYFLKYKGDPNSAKYNDYYCNRRSLLELPMAVTDGDYRWFTSLELVFGVAENLESQLIL